MYIIFSNKWLIILSTCFSLIIIIESQLTYNFILLIIHKKCHMQQIDKTSSGRVRQLFNL